MPLENDGYSYRVIWSIDHEKYIALCAEFPDLSWFAEDLESAFKGIRKLVADTVRKMKQNGEAVPQSRNVRYNGKSFTCAARPCYRS
ncbi:MAG: toxin-antitoxin system HicB family antitoxin [Dehalococcoidia bacterium]|nr:toxin-antitoxin system HicB family antitoxin [Dehalococcoidia bacterium]